MNYNHVTLIGRAGQDPTLKYLPDGKAFAHFSLVISTPFKTTSGEWQDRTDWFLLKLWDKQAERAAEHIRKGNLILIDGRLKHDQWTDSQSGEKKDLVYVAVNHWKHLESKDNRATTPQDQPAQPAEPESPPPPDDDIPF
ncbi:single-stranded DNA-binding protein [bacterium]|nr:single-stranded DNA-binding protein [bacterium]